MSTEQFIYSEDFVRGRIYSYLKFKKYLRSIAKIVCEKLQYDQEIIDVNITSDGKTVWVTFKESEFGFDASFLWDKKLKETIERHMG